MASLPKTIRQSELAGRLVLLRDSMQEVGHVDVVWMHPPVHRVFGFICASGFLGRKKSAFNLPQLHTIGEDGLLVSSTPVQTDAQKVRQIETLLGYELWSDSGEKVGHVVDYVFDTKTGAIQAYLFTSHPLAAITGGLYKLTPRQMLSYGDRRIRVRDQVLESPELYKPGLRQRLATVGESVLESAEEEWRSIADQAAMLREQTLERLQSLTEQAKDKAVPLSEQAREKAQTFTERAREQGLGFFDRLRDQTRSFTEQIRTEFDGTWERAADEELWAPSSENASSGEYRWDTQPGFNDLNSEDEQFDDFEDDWEGSTAATSVSAASPASRTREDEDDEWDTWDIDESDDVLDSADNVAGSPGVSSTSPPVAPTPAVERQSDKPPHSSSDAQSPFSAQTIHPVDHSLSMSEGSTELGALDETSPSEEESLEVDPAIASSQSTTVPHEPAPLDDIDDDDPWI